MTRMKGNATNVVMETRKVSRDRQVLKDETIFLTSFSAAEKCHYPMRRIEFRDEKKNETLVS